MPKRKGVFCGIPTLSQTLIENSWVAISCIFLCKLKLSLNLKWMKSVVNYFCIVQESKYLSTMNCVCWIISFLDIWWNFNFNWSPCLDEGSEHHKWANELLALIRSKLSETTRWYNIQSRRGDDDGQNLPNTQCFWSIRSCRRRSTTS